MVSEKSICFVQVIKSTNDIFLQIKLLNINRLATTKNALI